MSGLAYEDVMAPLLAGMWGITTEQARSLVAVAVEHRVEHGCGDAACEDLAEVFQHGVELFKSDRESPIGEALSDFLYPAGAPALVEQHARLDRGLHSLLPAFKSRSQFPFRVPGLIHRYLLRLRGESSEGGAR